MHRKRRGSEKSTFLTIFWVFFWFSQDRLFSMNSTRKPSNLIKSPIFTNTPCKSTCLYNAPSIRGPVWLDDRGTGQWKWLEEVPRRTSRAPLAFPCFVHCLIRVEAEGFLDYQGRAGIISIVRWNLRPVIFGAPSMHTVCSTLLIVWVFSVWQGPWGNAWFNPWPHEVSGDQGPDQQLPGWLPCNDCSCQ